MFDLDIAIINYIYSICKEFGACFLLGPMEGFILLAGTIGASIASCLTPKRSRK